MKLKYILFTLVVVLGLCSCTRDEDEPSMFVPDFELYEAPNVTGTTATISGKVTPHSELSDFGVVYSATDGMPTVDTATMKWANSQEFTLQLTDLQPGTTYYFRFFARNYFDAAYSAVYTFTTAGN